MGSSKSNCFRNTILVVYVLAFVGLTGFGIWDVTQIIIDYIEDNQFSLIKVRNSTVDRYRFVPMLQVYLLHPPKLFISGNYEGFLYDQVNSSWHQEDIVWPGALSEKEASLASDLINLQKMTLITQIDDEGPDSINEVADRNLNIDRSKFKVMVSNFIENPQTIVSTKRALETMKNMIIQGRPKHGSPISVGMLGLGRTDLCFLLPLADDLHDTGNNVRYFFDFAYKENNSNISIKQQSGSVVYTLVKNIITLDWNTKPTTMNLVTIATNGLFDSSRFPPCTSDFDEETDCLQDQKRKIIADVCQCTQFSYAWWNDFFGNKTQRFCTMEIYDQCWEKAREEFERQEKVARESGACKPCSFAKNTYTLTSTKIDPKLLPSLEETFRPWSPRSIVTFNCSESTYLFFEERQQFGPSQLISQVGGDLGLYIGFSMISILQLLVSMYNMRQRRLESINVDGSTPNGRGHFYLQQILSSVFETDTKEEQCSTDEWVFRKDMIDLKSEMKDEINRLETRLYEKLDDMLREFRLASKSKIPAPRRRRK